MTKVMGWDLSIAMTGIALPSGQLDRFHPKGDGDDRLPQIERCLEYYVTNSKPDVVVIEKIPESLRGGVITIVRLALVHGVGRLVLARHGIPHAYVPVPTLKKYATGNGTADKPAMINAAKDLGIEVRDDNEADAAFCRMIGRHHYDRVPPSAQHALCLELISGPRSRVDWPNLGGGRTIPHRGR